MGVQVPPCVLNNEEERKQEQNIMTAPKSKNLKIDTLCLGFGQNDTLRTEVVYIEWTGTPFKTAEDCLQSFFAACDARISVATKPLPKCCEKSKKADSTAKFCSRCGKSLTENESSKRTQTMYSYIIGLRTGVADFENSVFPIEPAWHCGDNYMPGHNEAEEGEWVFLYEPAWEGTILYVPDAPGLLGARSMHDLANYCGEYSYQVIKRTNRDLESGAPGDLLSEEEEEEDEEEEDND